VSPEILAFLCGAAAMSPAIAFWAVFNFIDNRGNAR